MEYINITKRIEFRIELAIIAGFTIGYLIGLKGFFTFTEKGLFELWIKISSLFY